MILRPEHDKALLCFRLFYVGHGSTLSDGPPPLLHSTVFLFSHFDPSIRPGLGLPGINSTIFTPEIGLPLPLVLSKRSQTSLY